MIYTLLITLILLLMVSFYLFDKDIFSPSIILCAVYIFSTLCAIYNIEMWDLKLHLNTYMIIIFGLVPFIFVSFVVHVVYKRKSPNEVKPVFVNANSQIQDIQRGKVYIAIIFSGIVAIIYLYSVRKIAFAFGASNDITDILFTFRNVTSYGDDAALPLIVKQLYKISKAIGYVFIFVFINNVVFGKSIKNNLIYLLPAIIFMLTSLFGANRIEVLQLFLAALTLYYVLWNRKNKWTININAKFIKLLFISLILFFSFFSFIRPFVGRLNESDTLYYITSYAGGSIQLLDLYLQNPLPPSNIWGKETFGALNQDFAKFGIGSTYIRHLEFRYSNGILLGNVYTAFRSYIRDFGLLGMALLQIILALFYTGWYERIKTKYPKKYADFNLLVYAYLIITIFEHSIADTFYSGYVSINTLVMLSLLKLCHWFFIRVKIV